MRGSWFFRLPRIVFLCGKKSMRRFVWLLMAVLMAACSISCRKVICECRCHEYREDVFPGNDSGDGTGGEPETVKVTGFNIVLAEYPDGYDWLRDPDHGVVECDICLLQDGQETLRFPAGNEYMVSADIDMVRCIGEDVFVQKFVHWSLTPNPARSRPSGRKSANPQTIAPAVPPAGARGRSAGGSGKGCPPGSASHSCRESPAVR